MCVYIYIYVFMYYVFTYRNNQHQDARTVLQPKKHTTSSMQKHPLKTANVKTHGCRSITFFKPAFRNKPAAFILYCASHTIPFVSRMETYHAISQQEQYCGEIDDLWLIGDANGCRARHKVPRTIKQNSWTSSSNKNVFVVTSAHSHTAQAPPKSVHLKECLRSGVSACDKTQELMSECKNKCQCQPVAGTIKLIYHP